MTHALLELIGLAVPQLESEPNLIRRAELMEAAADVCQQNNFLERADRLRSAATELRTAHNTQLRIEELFSRADQP